MKLKILLGSGITLLALASSINTYAAHHSNASNIYTNRGDFVNVYKYTHKHHRLILTRYRHFKKLGRCKVGQQIKFHGFNFRFVSKLHGYIPGYELKRVRLAKKRFRPTRIRSNNMQQKIQNAAHSMKLS